MQQSDLKCAVFNSHSPSFSSLGLYTTASCLCFDLPIREKDDILHRRVENRPRFRWAVEVKGKAECVPRIPIDRELCKRRKYMTDNMLAHSPCKNGVLQRKDPCLFVNTIYGCKQEQQQKNHLGTFPSRYFLYIHLCKSVSNLCYCFVTH